MIAPVVKSTRFAEFFTPILMTMKANVFQKVILEITLISQNTCISMLFDDFS